VSKKEGSQLSVIESPEGLSCKCTINPITNPNPILYSRRTLDNIIHKFPGYIIIIWNQNMAVPHKIITLKIFFERKIIIPVVLYNFNFVLVNGFLQDLPKKMLGFQTPATRERKQI
jgi:hypothetical protein